jgi:hypothetical protein
MLSSTALKGPQSAPVTLMIPKTAAMSKIQKLSDSAKTTSDPAIMMLPMNKIRLLPSLSATSVSKSDSITSPSNVNVMNTPMRESGKSSEAKNKARIRLGMPAVNMRKERSVMMMYASRPMELSDVIPRKSATRDKMGRGITLRVQGQLKRVLRCLP